MSAGWSYGCRAQGFSEAVEIFWRWSGPVWANRNILTVVWTCLSQWKHPHSAMGLSEDRMSSHGLILWSRSIEVCETDLQGRPQHLWTCCERKSYCYLLRQWEIHVWLHRFIWLSSCLSRMFPECRLFVSEETNCTRHNSRKGWKMLLLWCWVFYVFIL